MKRIIVAVLISLLAVNTVFAAGGGENGAFPTRNITMICPWSAGGGTDAILRALSAAASKQLGVNIIVDNRTGGAGAIGHAAIMNARADGYTMGMITFELNSLPQQGLVNFTFEDFEPLILVNADAAALTVHVNAPYNTVREFVEYARRNPGTISIGNSAPGSVWHIGAGLLASETGIQVNHIPFEGAAGAVTALAGGHIQAVSVSLAEVRSQVEAGNVKVLGVMDAQRSPMFPNVPTFREQGFDIVYQTWRGLALPRGVDPAIRETLERAFTAAVEDPAFVEQARNLNLNLYFLPSGEFATFLRDNKEAVTRTMIDLGMVN
ncbi:MAG: tripartite tricarboxylate transporter substrate binding protein [Treponema sp.]|nr:tripartite tricarboxylate transporter substrate binding protein [Treponema sp.]